MAGRQASDVVDEVIRDLDLVVFRLERPLEGEPAMRADRAAVRRELERLRDKLAEVLPRLT